jgi:hypothetical protein
MIRGMHLTCYLNIHSHRYLAQLRYYHQATSNNSRFDACFLSGLKPLPPLTLAARHKLPAVFYERFFVGGGGLISHGPDYLNEFRRAAV